MTKVRELREKRGISIVAMSHDARVNPSVLSMTERGRLAPSKNVREAVSAFFGMAEEKLFDTAGFAK